MEQQNTTKKTVLDVYVCKFPFEVENHSIFPRERLEEINAVSNAQLKEQKFYAWKLLEYALKRSFGSDIKTVKFTKQNGKWTCDEYKFSISHCNDVLAVAVSRENVGVDVELVNPARFKMDLARKICAERELINLLLLNENERALKLNAMWTVKEAAFKRLGGKTFVPSRIEISTETHTTKQLRCGNKTYFLSVASLYADKAEFNFANVDLV